MKAKVLKHKIITKTTRGLYGVIGSDYLCTSLLPQLFPMSCTMKGLKVSSNIFNKERLDLFKLITVEVKEIK